MYEQHDMSIDSEKKEGEMPANDQIVGTAEIAEMCGVTPAAVSNWISRGTDDFPQPFATLRSGTIFLEKEIIAWMLRTNRAGKWIVERMAESAHNLVVGDLQVSRLQVPQSCVGRRVHGPVR